MGSKAEGREGLGRRLRPRRVPGAERRARSGRKKMRPIMDMHEHNQANQARWQPMSVYIKEKIQLGP